MSRQEGCIALATFELSKSLLPGKMSRTPRRVSRATLASHMWPQAPDHSSSGKGPVVTGGARPSAQHPVSPATQTLYDWDCGPADAGADAGAMKAGPAGPYDGPGLATEQPQRESSSAAICSHLETRP